MSATPAAPLRATPAREEFLALAATCDLVPVCTELVADALTPVAAYHALVGEGEGFLLESADAERFGRYSFVGKDPLGTFLRRPDGSTTVTGALPATGPHEGALAYVERALGALRTAAIPGLDVFTSGLVGFLAYDVVREVERLPEPRTDDLSHPDAAFHLVGELLVFDHWRERLVVVVNVPVAGADRTEAAARYESAVERLGRLVERLAAVPVLAPFAPPPRQGLELVPPPANRTSDDYRRAVEAAKAHIVAGDIFQVVLSQRFDCTVSVPAIAVYRALRILNPSPYLYLLRVGGWTILGSSPEALVRLEGRRAVMRPIAGSRPRSGPVALDERLAAELAEDPKERAEHVMLVDLGRNDLGRVSRYGTVRVEELMVLERFSHITHLTSQVAGEVRDDVSAVDVLRATLPAGTLSGAPKVRAMELIAELEPTRRGVYGGVVGYLDATGGLDTAIAIRTLVVGPDGHGSVQAGAGIVADSDPAAEDEECRAKAAALFAALAAAQAAIP